MQMKCKRNLERAIVLGLILSTGVCGSAWAEYTSIDDSGKWIGIMDRNGQGASISTDKTFDSINVNATGVPANYNNSSKTTTALLVNSGNTVTVNGAVSIINNATHEDIENNNALYVANNGSRVTINGGNDNVFICAINGNGNRDAAITAKRNGHVSITGNNVQIIGSVDFIGDGSTTMNTTDIILNSKNSFWYGNELQALSEEQFNIYKSNPFIYAIMQIVGIKNYEDVIDKIGGGNLNLELNNGAEWVYDSSGSNFMFVPGFQEELPIQSEPTHISAITLNGGVVNLQDDDIKAKYADYIGDLSKYKEHHKVTIGELKGSGGIFKVDLDWETNKGKNVETKNSDYIYIEKVEGTDSKQIVDFDASKAHLENMEINKDRLYFANVADGNTSFTTLSSVYSNAGNVFDYTYGTGSEDGANDSEDWYIAVSGKSAESNPNFSAAKGAMYAGYALGTELDTLNKRMGEARYLEEDDGVWVRYRHSKTGWDDTYETNGDMFQLGFDNEVTEKDGKHYRGVAIDYTDADTNIMGISGEGEHERYAVSLYDTWLGEKGHYRDLVLRGGRINSDYDISGVFSSGYEDIGGDYHQWFGSISAEWGRKNDMGTGWYFEPQVQAQLARVGGASYVSDSGVDVDQDGATSLIGRAGFRIGREYVKDNGKHDNFYIKADLLHEFAGDKSFSLDGNDGRYDKEYDGQETWCDIGIGADISLGKNSYFWADVERTFGADFDNTWQINGGFRWEF